MIDHQADSGFRWLMIKMRSSVILLALSFAFLTSGCVNPSKKPQSRDLEALFKKADADGDGRVSREEFADFMIEQVFVNYDRNGNGFVTQAEYLDGGGTLEGFRKINRSGSGKITLPEAKASKLVRDRMTLPFDEADGNGNGYVTWDEFQKFRVRAAPYVG